MNNLKRLIAGIPAGPQRAQFERMYNLMEMAVTSYAQKHESVYDNLSSLAKDAEAFSVRPFTFGRK